MKAWRRVLVAFAFPFLLLSAVIGIFLMIVGDRERVKMRKISVNLREPEK